MNSLEQYFEENCFDSSSIADAMNRLQMNGIISDNCVDPKDVYEHDAKTAVEWLDENL